MHQVIKREILRIIDEGIDAGYLITVSTHKEDTPLSNCIILQNSISQKHIIMFLSSDKKTSKTIPGTWRQGDNVAIYYGVDVNKWDWAKSEGFTINDVFDSLQSNVLYDSIFQIVTPTSVVKYLA